MAANPNLPPYFTEGQTSFMKRAELLDPEHAHRWINVNTANQVEQAWKGWEPVEDKDELVRLGLGALIHVSGRARYHDVELWRMPMARAEAIREFNHEKLVDRSTSVKNQLAELAADTAGRSGGKVVQTVTAGYAPSTDILTKEPLVIPATGSKATAKR